MNYATAPINKTIPINHNIDIIQPLILNVPGLNAFVNRLSRFEYLKFITPKPINIIIANIPTSDSIFLFINIKNNNFKEFQKQRKTWLILCLSMILLSIPLNYFLITAVFL